MPSSENRRDFDTNPHSSDEIGVIRADTLYTRDAFMARLGFKDAAWRSAYRQGLRVRYCHGRAFVYGGDFIEYIRQQPDPNQAEGKWRKWTGTI